MWYPFREVPLILGAFSGSVDQATPARLPASSGALGVLATALCLLEGRVPSTGRPGGRFHAASGAIRWAGGSAGSAFLIEDEYSDGEGGDQDYALGDRLHTLHALVTDSYAPPSLPFSLVYPVDDYHHPILSFPLAGCLLLFSVVFTPSLHSFTCALSLCVTRSQVGVRAV